MPVFAPWGLSVHPDCAANAYVITEGDQATVADDLVPLGRLFQRMGQRQAGQSVLPAALALPQLLLSTTPVAGWPKMIAHGLGSLSGRGRRGVLLIGIGGFCREDFCDTARTHYCPTRITTPEGLESPCVYLR